MVTRRCAGRNSERTDGDVIMNQRIELSKRVKKECHAMGHDMDRFKKINQMTIGTTCKTCGAHVWLKQKSDNSYEINGTATCLS